MVEKVFQLIFYSIPSTSRMDKLLSFKGAVTSLILEIRLHAHRFSTNTRSGTEAIFTLIWLAHAFGTSWFAHILISGLKDGAATLNDSFVLLSATLCSHEVVFNLGNHGGLVVIELLALDVFQEKPEKKYKEKNNIRLWMIWG